jgi:hypothetical protein
MKLFTKKLLIVSAIVMSLAAMPAFGGDENHHRGPQIDTSVINIVSGCVISIHDGTVDGITLCVNDACPDLCPNDQKITILGIGPPFYWYNPYTATIEENDEGILIITNIYEPNDIAVPVPVPGDFVTIGTYPNPDGDLIALWAQTSALDEDIVVLLRNLTTLECLWKGMGNNN